MKFHVCSTTTCSVPCKLSNRYILLSNIYAAAGRWEDVKEVRGMMLANGVAKTPGMSMTELDSEVSQFVAGDRSHPQSEDIYLMLMEISERLKVEAGYLPDTREVLLDIGEEEKEQALLVHSEKLAIAFALLHTKPECSIRVVKNLRVCSDCHNFAKLVSKFYGRDIIMRDRNRFHLFKEGACSCMDYW
ncbi:Pentatricopeptide repeat-containing protein [Canna indica]|uniref:Pentatricopeptide repeat-containing protein n=1 Tax=Canna indica TaxID=4628 RepID=A0AAQ3KJD2_9LILI|nr:Pentatricopeptide repeat-containing protein [Canna indica]